MPGVPDRTKNRRLLNERELRVLLNTPMDRMCRVFPHHTQRYLIEQKKKAQAEMPIEERLDLDAERLRQASKQRETDRLLKEALKRIATLEGDLEFYQGAPSIEPHIFTVGERRSKNREAVPILCASDWHAGATVTSEQTSGLNTFDLKIFEERAKFFFVNSLKLIAMSAKSVDIRNIVLWLGGDFFEGNIHPDIVENAQLGLMDQVSLVQDTLAGGIEMLLKSLPSGTKITIPTSTGNHSRVTGHDQRISTEAENSLEHLLYLTLARFFKEEKRVTFIRSRGYLTTLDILGHKVRFSHGTAIRYSDGVGGPTIPITKRIANWNKGEKVYLDVMGHLHVLIFGTDFVVNGSLIGQTAFGQSIGATFQRPQQAFLLMDSKWGLTVRAPIILEEV